MSRHGPGAAEHQLAPADTMPERSEPRAQPDSEVAGYVPMAPEGESPRPEVARREAPPVPAPAGRTAVASRPADDPPVDRRKLEDRMRAGVEECYRSVRSKELERLARIYAPKTVADEEKLRRLTRILRTEPWQAVVGRRVDGVRELGSKAAAAEFSFRLAWRDSYGGRLSSQPIFRAEFIRQGEEWTMSSCRIVGSPKL